MRVLVSGNALVQFLSGIGLRLFEEAEDYRSSYARTVRVGSGDVDHKCDSRDSRVARSPHRRKERALQGP